ncbi:MAG: hypothetical protein ACM3JH_01115, partial [Acidithiobacillales bacterium]
SDITMPDRPHPRHSGDAARLRADRERFLSEFALALVGEADMPGFLDWSVGEIGRLLEAVPHSILWTLDGVNHAAS